MTDWCAHADKKSPAGVCFVARVQLLFAFSNCMVFAVAVLPGRCPEDYIDQELLHRAALTSQPGHLIGRPPA